LIAQTGIGGFILLYWYIIKGNADDNAYSSNPFRQFD